MATYDYRCKECNHQYEVTEPINKHEKHPLAPCPKCGSNMVLRTAKTGAWIGKQFWGCCSYPRCDGKLTA